MAIINNDKRVFCIPCYSDTVIASDNCIIKEMQAFQNCGVQRIVPIIEKAINELEKLKGSEAHSSYIIDKSELNALKNLGINLTCEPIM